MSEKSDKKPGFQETLNLPQTGFPMKADLLNSEVATQKRWKNLKIYEQIQKQTRKDRYTLHDGPPYANGSIHMGHLLNKVLKDIVVRSRMMMGKKVEFYPGWDCHGLPIEHRVQEDLKKKEGAPKSIQEIRRLCQDYAEKFKAIQASEMQRLGTIGDYDHPYLTMNPEFEAGTLELFATLVENGLVYRGLKPVHWSIENQTALAEAELEYKDREDPSIFVEFPLESQALGQSSLLVWTTTPWTLPANLAVALAPEGEYGLFSCTQGGKKKRLILARALSEKVFAAAGATDVVMEKTWKGSELAALNLEYRHPFIDRKSPVYPAEFVTLEDGTGLVHIAPGHGVEDYQLGLKQGLPIYCPVKNNGTYDDTVPEWLKGIRVWKANTLVCEKLTELGLLFYLMKITHSYPHDWRSKTPTIFRATEQWFIGVDRSIAGGSDTLRKLALHQIKNDIEFVPELGRNRLNGMLESRPDWCISRQRAWGLPIPAFYSAEGETLVTAETVRAVSRVFREAGSNAWFEKPPSELLNSYDPSKDSHAPDWLKKGGKTALESLKKGADTFDVWFESGSSWNSVLKQRGLPVPADLYLEGSDQHRGWFQVSLLTGLGAMKHAPFKRLLTHGFMVDIEGKKMSKSAGNAVTVEQLLGKYGADIARWWVSSVQYINDIKIDWSHFQVASEEYRKIRNTLRFLLGNISDFSPQTDAVRSIDPHSIDAWARAEIQKSIRSILEGYETYQFQRAHDELFRLCNETLSAIYFSTVKDRLYCDPKNSPRRRQTQTVFYETVDALIRLLGPILVHTADEAWIYFSGLSPDRAETTVHWELFPQSMAGAASNPDWEEVLRLRSVILKTVESEKAGVGLTNPMDAGVDVTLPENLFNKLLPFREELVDLCNLSQLQLKKGTVERVRLLDLRSEPRCERSWKRDGTVKPRKDGSLLSDRDAAVMGV